MSGKVLKAGIIVLLGIIGFALAVPSGLISLLLATVAIVVIKGAF